ncbi:MAG: penicillin-binding protein 2 [Patescibacteria group bacterium]|jgi:penicillin-binding protein 2
MIKNNPFKIQEGQIRDSKVGDFIKQKKSGDYLDFGLIDKTQQLGRFFEEKKIRSLFFIFALFLFILFSRSFYLQVLNGEHFRNVAEGNRIRSDVIKANRGLIYDRFGNLLVKNISYFFLYIHKDILPSDELLRQDLFNKLSSILEIPKDDLETMIFDEKSKLDKVLIYENLSYDLAMKVMIFSENQPSVEVAYESRRQYFSNLGISHSLGYLGSVTEQDIENGKYNYNDRIAKAGLELTYEDILKGQDGIRQIEVDALFREKNILSMIEPVHGSDLILTIDSKAQEKLFEIMQKNSERYDKTKMAAVVLDPKDGGVLAMVSLPSYDNNIFTSVLNTEEYKKIIENEDLPLLNRVISGTYPMGSIFKTVISSAALEEKLITPSFTVNSTGGVQLGSNFFPDWRPGGHGLTNIYWALADSVNTFFYSIGGGNNQWLSLGLGVDKIIDYARKFSLGKATGIDLSSEADGFLPSKDWKEKTFGERWYLGDTYNLSIGQGFLLTTPLQTATLMSYFANNGQVYKPHFIEQIKTAALEKTNDDKTEVYKPEIFLDNIISSDNLNIIRKGLRMTVTDGTAQSLKSVAVNVAGKTGTAQFNRNKTPHSWMAAFAPYDDAKIVTAVIVEEGGDIGLAVTITREFMEWYFSQ